MEDVVIVGDTKGSDTVQGALGNNSTTNPAQFSTLASQAAPADGVYRIDGWALKTGTDDAQIFNLMVKAPNGGGTNRMPIITPLGVLVPYTVPRVTLRTGDTPQIVTLQASVAGCVYQTTMCLTKLG